MNKETKKFISNMLVATLVYSITLVICGVLLYFVRNHISDIVHNNAELIATMLAFTLYVLSYKAISKNHYAKDVPFISLRKFIIGYLIYVLVFIALSFWTEDYLLAGFWLAFLTVLAYKISLIVSMRRVLRYDSTSPANYGSYDSKPTLYLIVTFIPVYILTSLSFNAARGLSLETISISKYGLEPQISFFIDFLFILISVYYIQYVNYVRRPLTIVNVN